MVAWSFGRGLGGLAKACGCSQETSSAVGVLGGAILAPIDPVGAVVNAIHAVTQMEAASGNQKAKALNVVMSVAVLGDGAGDLNDFIKGEGGQRSC